MKLFHPYVSKEMREAVDEALKEEVIAQGEKVEEFERAFSNKVKRPFCLSVNSGTSALELAYDLLNLNEGDEVITPVFTCTATNLPLARRGVKIVFADVKYDLTLDYEDVKRKITPKTKAVVNVHLFGKENRIGPLKVPVVGDSAQFLGTTHNEDFTTYSFQAVKVMTTVDGGVLVTKRAEDYTRGKLLRWYGIDREQGIPNIDVDITEAGYKYHMNDVTAAMGLAGLNIVDLLQEQRARMEQHYMEGLEGIPGIIPIGGQAPFLALVHDREKFMETLSHKCVDTGLGHRRNDVYSVFGGKRLDLPTMNLLESRYVLLPLHNKMDLIDIDNICARIKEGW